MKRVHLVTNGMKEAGVKEFHKRHRNYTIQNITVGDFVALIYGAMEKQHELELLLRGK